MVRKMQDADYFADGYVEKIVEVESGIVLRDVSEKRTEHHGHGSANPRSR